MAQELLPLRWHFTECHHFAVGPEHRIETESVPAPDRPDEAARDFALEHRVDSVRPGNADGASKTGSSGFGYAPVFEHSPGPCHGLDEVSSRRGLRPVGRVNSWRSGEGVHLDPAVVGERGQAGLPCDMVGLDSRVPGKAGFRFGRFGQTILGCRNHALVKRLEQSAELFELSTVVRGENDRRFRQSPRDRVQGMAAF